MKRRWLTLQTQLCGTPFQSTSLFLFHSQREKSATSLSAHYRFNARPFRGGARVELIRRHSSVVRPSVRVRSLIFAFARGIHSTDARCDHLRGSATSCRARSGGCQTKFTYSRVSTQNQIFKIENNFPRKISVHIYVMCWSRSASTLRSFDVRRLRRAAYVPENNARVSVARSDRREAVNFPSEY